MFLTLVQKELKNVLLSPKFPATFTVSAILILLSVYIGISEYRIAVKNYETAQQLTAQELREQTRWTGLNNKTYRAPDPMQIFVSGVNNDIGRYSGINQFNPVKLRHSIYSDDPIFALFRFIDFSFIVQIVFSLFAFLFTYDAINGERETGTLALTFSNSVPRAQYLIAKLAGSWLGLVVPLLIPTTIAALMVVLFNIPFDFGHWMKFFSLLGVSLLYFTFFVTLGLCFSAFTNRSNISFLLCLVAWVVTILILPRAGVIVASHIVTVPTVAEVEAQQDAFAKDKWAQHHKTFEVKIRERQEKMAGMSKEEREQYENDQMWGWMEEDDARRKQMEKEIDAYGDKLQEDLRNRKAGQERLAFILSRFSPASAYQLAVMSIAGTDINLKARYEDALRAYRTTFNEYTEKKQKESGDLGGIRITVDSDKGVSINTPREKGTLNLSDMPQFTPVNNAALFPVVDIGILIFLTLIVFAGSVVGFMRYDLRT